MVYFLIIKMQRMIYFLQLFPSFYLPPSFLPSFLFSFPTFSLSSLSHSFSFFFSSYFRILYFQNIGFVCGSSQITFFKTQYVFYSVFSPTFETMEKIPIKYLQFNSGKGSHSVTCFTVCHTTYTWKYIIFIISFG